MDGPMPVMGVWSGWFVAIQRGAVGEGYAGMMMLLCASGLCMYPEENV